jgi:DNA-binding MarR family transcriptional regulator
MSTHELYDVLERICNLIRGELRAYGVQHGLQPVQLDALAYLVQCNRYSDTPHAVTEFLGLTKGTVSQSLKVLEAKGLVRKIPDKSDKRVVHLKPTTRGRRLVGQAIPGRRLAEGLAMVNHPDNADLSKMLGELLRGIQHANGLKSFGACRSCRFNRKTRTGFLCGLTSEPLSADDTLKICREHEYDTNS